MVDYGSNGIEIDWSAFYDNETRHRVSLPTYPFERKRYWIEDTKELDLIKFMEMGKETFSENSESVLTEKKEFPNWFYRPVWKQSHLYLSKDPEKLVGKWLVFSNESAFATRILNGIL